MEEQSTYPSIQENSIADNNSGLSKHLYRNKYEKQEEDERKRKFKSKFEMSSFIVATIFDILGFVYVIIFVFLIIFIGNPSRIASGLFVFSLLAFLDILSMKEAEVSFVKEGLMDIFNSHYKRKIKKKYETIYLLYKVAGFYDRSNDSEVKSFLVDSTERDNNKAILAELQKYALKINDDEEYMKEIDNKLYNFKFLLVKIEGIKDELRVGDLGKEPSLKLLTKINEALDVVLKELEKIDDQKHKKAEKLTNDFVQALENDLDQELQLLKEVKTLHGEGN